MKPSLKTKLALSYVALVVLVVVFFIFISNFILEKQFQSYVMDKQEQKNLDYVLAIQNEIDAGNDITGLTLLALGQKALNDGIVLMVNDKSGNEVFCMSCYDNIQCENMLSGMEQTMRKIYPDFIGKYTEKLYPIYKDNANYAIVTLGFYGPFYYTHIDIAFISVLNSMFGILGGLLLIIAIIIGFAMAYRIANPIHQVIQSTHRIKQGNYSDTINLKSNTKEIEDLINSINSLAVTLNAQKAIKKQMASDYAHEFRTPLATMQSNLEGIIDGVFEPTDERLESIRQEILRLSRMVSEIDKIVELESPKISLNITNFSLDEVIRQTASTFEHEMKAKNIVLVINTQACMIQADHDKISQVIVNLLSNAVKYTDCGQICVTLKNSPDIAIIKVKDTGTGIEEKDMPYIFEHLYRADRSRNRNTGGTGIGLAVVKSIVEAHGGKVEVTSSLSKGSEFVITLKKVTEVSCEGKSL